MRLTAIALALVVSSDALADEGVLTTLIGGGPVFSPQEGASPLSVHGAVLLKSVYGLTDRVNLEGPAFFESTAGQWTMSLGSGLEYVYWGDNHLQLSLGGGAALTAPLSIPGPLDLRPYVQATVRWTLGWGFGVSLELHALYALGLANGGSRQLTAAPTLAIFQELF